MLHDVCLADPYFPSSWVAITRMNGTARNCYTGRPFNISNWNNDQDRNNLPQGTGFATTRYMQAWMHYYGGTTAYVVCMEKL
jgi:hypothetical protein